MYIYIIICIYTHIYIYIYIYIIIYTVYKLFLLRSLNNITEDKIRSTVTTPVILSSVIRYNANKFLV